MSKYSERREQRLEDPDVREGHDEMNIIYLDAENWDKFNEILNRPPRILPRLRAMFKKGSIFKDEV